MLRHVSAGLLLSLCAAPAISQAPPSASLFPKANFVGQPLELSGPATNLGGMTVKSLRISDGSAWDLCSGNTFTGCKRFSRSLRGMVAVVRSARPVAEIIEARTQHSDAVAAPGPAGPSLRGFASEFYVEPSQYGKRIEVDAGPAGGASMAAVQFCRARGWQTSAYDRVQSVGGRHFLADVLCADR